MLLLLLLVLSCLAAAVVAGEYFLALMDTLSEGTKGLPCAEELKQVSEPSPPCVLMLLLPSLFLSLCRSLSLSLCVCVCVCVRVCVNSYTL
eukprot:COSAG06_NODE_84_length_25090_cov_20.561042_29_plen_91_part_00